MCVCDVQTSSESEDGIVSPAIEDIGSCELPDMRVGNQTQVLSKSRKFS